MLSTTDPMPRIESDDWSADRGPGHTVIVTPQPPCREGTDHAALVDAGTCPVVRAKWIGGSGFVPKDRW